MDRLLLVTKYIVLLLTLSILAQSCTDSDLVEIPDEKKVTFRVFECNQPYFEDRSPSARFISEDASVIIWKKIGSDFVLSEILNTNEEGIVKYAHDDQPIYYSASKRVVTENGESEVKENLYTLGIIDKDANLIKYLKFQIEGVFTSEEDIAAHAAFNILPTHVSYVPHVGAIKLKDINGDNLIDEKDAIVISSINPNRSKEESVYLSKVVRIK